MSCAHVTETMRDVLSLLHMNPRDEEARALPEFETALQWGWIMHTGELTGAGISHLGAVTGGILE